MIQFLSGESHEAVTLQVIGFACWLAILVIAQGYMVRSGFYVPGTEKKKISIKQRKQWLVGIMLYVFLLVSFLYSFQLALQLCLIAIILVFSVFIGWALKNVLKFCFCFFLSLPTILPAAKRHWLLLKSTLYLLVRGEQEYDPRD